MSYLKPAVAISVLNIESKFIDKLNIKMLVDCLSMGEYSNGIILLNKFRSSCYTKCAYDFLPKAFKYNIAETTFEHIEFSYTSFYQYNVDVKQVYIDYCEEIFNRYPSAKKVKRFYKELKKENPEYFI